jgi:hypothetical protein
MRELSSKELFTHAGHAAPVPSEMTTAGSGARRNLASTHVTIESCSNLSCSQRGSNVEKPGDCHQSLSGNCHCLCTRRKTFLSLAYCVAVIHTLGCIMNVFAVLERNVWTLDNKETPLKITQAIIIMAVGDGLMAVLIIGLLLIGVGRLEKRELVRPWSMLACVPLLIYTVGGSLLLFVPVVPTDVTVAATAGFVLFAVNYHVLVFLGRPWRQPQNAALSTSKAPRSQLEFRAKTSIESAHATMSMAKTV